jgi:hypothetical protein
MADSQKELTKTKKLVDQIALIIAQPHHYFSEGEVRSIHKAMDWVAKANKDLERAEAALKPQKKSKKNSAGCGRLRA